jgi:ankyrin repeat protein
MWQPKTLNKSRSVSTVSLHNQSIDHTIGWNALMLHASVAESLTCTVIKFFISAGIDSSHMSNDGWTALLSAAKNPNVSVENIKTLVEGGSNVN